MTRVESLQSCCRSNHKSWRYYSKNTVVRGSLLQQSAPIGAEDVGAGQLVFQIPRWPGYTYICGVQVPDDDAWPMKNRQL
jgi:hypothetical protein